MENNEKHSQGSLLAGAIIVGGGVLSLVMNDGGDAFIVAVIIGIAVAIFLKD